MQEAQRNQNAQRWSQKLNKEDQSQRGIDQVSIGNMTKVPPYTQSFDLWPSNQLIGHRREERTGEKLSVGS